MLEVYKHDGTLMNCRNKNITVYGQENGTGKLNLSVWSGTDTLMNNVDTLTLVGGGLYFSFDSTSLSGLIGASANKIVVLNGKVGFVAWDRVAVTDWLLDFACMDLHRPYFLIPEKLIQYFEKKGIGVENFKERFLCMAYYKGLDVLRWHASIQDDVSCKTIMESISNLEERILNL